MIKMMAWKSTIITLLMVSLHLYLVKGQCSNVPNLATTNETAKSGTVLFSLTRTDENVTPTFEIQSQTLSDPVARAELKEYFSLTWTGPNGTFSVNRTLDLEELNVKFNGASLTTINVDLNCGGQPESIFINVVPVNEFRPIFKQGPYNISLPELEKVNSTIFSLRDKVQDQDIPTPTNFYFGTESYLIQDLNAQGYVRIGAATRGNIILTKSLDFNDKRELRLNVSVKVGARACKMANEKPARSSNVTSKDSVNKIHVMNVASRYIVTQDSLAADYQESFTTLTIHVLDEDNQDPYFNLTGCPKPCIAAPYTSVTTLTYTGEMAIKPEVFKVVDPDTLGTKLLFAIESGDDYGMFQINPNTGAVQQRRSVTEANYPESQIRLVIKVRKDITKDLSNIAILSVLIAGRAPVNDTDIPTVRKSTEKSETSLLIPVIILAIVLAILIVAIIVIVVIVRKKRKEAAVDPETDKSEEPQTEEEDLGTDRSEFPHVGDYNEKTVLNGKTTQGMTTDPLPPTPDGRARRLPPLPLRDSATETTEGKRKKRSRRRNKNKEPEIFDGTREYNMGADPEFFDSTDKSKVKRSQRSYDKKLDPALRIKVPNDNTVNDDSGYSG